VDATPAADENPHSEHDTTNTAKLPAHIQPCSMRVSHGSIRNGYVSRPSIEPRFESANSR
jgi:hypothetical protein